MKKPRYWNHNSVYYKWIKREISNCNSILDVGCGDGTLITFLDDGNRILYGIDIDQACVDRANAENKTENTSFRVCSLNELDNIRKYDAIIFVAAIHHMDMQAAILKAKTILNNGGMILIVGLASPSTIADHIIEILRVIPCRIISVLKHIRSSEDMDIPVSYNFPTLNEVRETISTYLPEAYFKQGLYYRYLLKWRNKSGN